MSIIKNRIQNKIRAAFSSLDLNEPNHKNNKTLIIGEQVSWILDALKNPTLHEKEFAIFKHFSIKDGVILDVGANYGYSFISFRAGSDCPVISFEILPEYEPFLVALKEKDQNFDYVSIGVGDKTDTLRVYVPVINGFAMTALTSSNPLGHLVDLAHNLEFSYYNHTPLGKTPLERIKRFLGTASPNIEIIAKDLPVSSLDQIMENRKFRFPTETITAIKIDVEGYERYVIKGASNLIKKHKPLIMVEGSNRCPWINEMLKSDGYKFCDYDGDSGLIVRDDKFISLNSNNGFFIHESKIDKYISQGMKLTID